MENTNVKLHRQFNQAESDLQLVTLNIAMVQIENCNETFPLQPKRFPYLIARAETTGKILKK